MSSLEEDISATFRKADKDNSGTLTVKEFKEALADISERFPEMQLYLKNKQIRSLVGLLKDSTELNIEEFKLAISQVDLQIKNLPATAQVAAQQGAYLANCFNRMEECEKIPEGQQCFGRFVSDFYRYKHFGKFVPREEDSDAPILWRYKISGRYVVPVRPPLTGIWASNGHSSVGLWYSFYTGKLVSGRTRKQVKSDWRRRSSFGRDSNQI